MYIYHVLINSLSAHMIHINLNTIFYTRIDTIKCYIIMWPCCTVLSRLELNARSSSSCWYGFRIIRRRSCSLAAHDVQCMHGALLSTLIPCQSRYHAILVHRVWDVELFSGGLLTICVISCCFRNRLFTRRSQVQLRKCSFPLFTIMPLCSCLSVCLSVPPTPTPHLCGYVRTPMYM